MYLKVKFAQFGDLLQLSKFCGMAPCQILRLNKATREHELEGREILIKVDTASLVRDVGWYWELKDGSISKRL